MVHILSPTYHSSNSRLRKLSGISTFALLFLPLFGSLAMAQSFFCPSTPRAIAVGDFNGDGNLDVASVRQGSRSVFVRPGDGQGGLGAPTPNPGLPAPPQRSTVVAADFVPGGSFEIVAANAAFTLFGTFTTLAASDFNHDGKLDAALVDGFNTVTVFLQSSFPNFSLSFTDSSVLSGVADIAVGDFNGDSHLDLAVAKRGDPFLQLSPGHEVAVFFGNGTGSFTRQPDIQTGGDGPQSIVAGDFNHDGKLDLAVLHFNSTDVSILLGDGHGNFVLSANSPISLPVGVETPFFPPRGASLVALDFNGDEKLDLVAATHGGHESNNRVFVLLGDGAGGFATSLEFDPGFPPRSIAAGDFNGDGRPDLAASFFCGSANDVKILLNPFPPSDTIPPITTATPSPAPNGNGWNNADVTVNLNATDNPGGSGVKEIQFFFSGAQLGSGTVSGSTASVMISAEGTTILTYFAKDNAGNQEAPNTLTIRIDKTSPTLACSVSPNTLWPPNHKMVAVTASVTVTDLTSGSAGFILTSVTSSEPDEGLGDGDFPNDIQGFIVGTSDTSGLLRAERSGIGNGRVYNLTYEGMDLAGNLATCSVTVTVPHDQRK